MRTLSLLFTLWFAIVAVQASDLKVELAPAPDWQKPILAKLTFDVKLRTLEEILEGKPGKLRSPSFLVFTAEAKENLGSRLLWADTEIELSDGRIMKFKGVCFHLLTKGLEAEIRKLASIDDPPPGDIFGDIKEKSDIQKELKVVRLKILGAVFK